MALEILALIVVYGESPLQTASFRSLAIAAKAMPDMHLLIWDNSPLPQSPIGDDTASLVRLTYVSTPENIGLSVIYNRVISEYLKPSEYLLVLDQDTNIPPEFFDALASAVRAYPDNNLFLPMVRSNHRWVSPAHYLLGWGRYWSNARPGIHSSHSIVAINSGMVISGEYLTGDDFPGYDEALRFYGTDTQFMVDYARRRNSLVVLDAVLQHDLSFFSSGNEARVRKFLEMKRAHLHIHARSGRFESWGAKCMLGLVSMAYAFKYRSLRCLSN